MSRPQDNSRGFSYGVTPAGLKGENAEDWSQGVISGIENVHVQTPRNEQLPASSAFADKPTTSTGSTVSSQADSVSQTNVPSTIANTASSGAATISNAAYSGAAAVSNTLSSVYNSAANAVSQATAPASTGHATTTTSTVPEVVLESQHTAHQSGEASTVPSAVLQKKTFEDELLSKTPMDGSSSVYNTVASAATQGYNAAASAASQGINALSQATQSAAQSAHQSLVEQGTDNAQATSSTVPAVVKESQLRSQQPAEASAVPQAVSLKAAMEEELISNVPSNYQAIGVATGQGPRPTAQTMNTQEVIDKIPGAW